MQNEEFVKMLGIAPSSVVKRSLAAMEKYGDNHWWEPDVDPRKYAYYQIHEEILLGSFSHFHESLELLLGRPVWTHEFGIRREALRQEAERAWTYQVGVTSEAKRQERIAQSLENLEKWAKDHGKPVIMIHVEEANNE